MILKSAGSVKRERTDEGTKPALSFIKCLGDMICIKSQRDVIRDNAGVLELMSPYPG